MDKVLAVDDEIKNLKLIKGFLGKDNYDVVTVENGEQAWEILHTSYSAFDVVLIDRMMPGMSGMALIEKIKSHQKMKRIPLVMQTAATSKEQIAEGIAAGVYYYLTKPYSPEILKSVVDSAIAHHKEQASFLEKGELCSNAIVLMDSSEFSFSNLDELRILVSFISSFFPEPERVTMGISELLINALEHGNLGISYDEKTELNYQGIWEKEVCRRQALPENKLKKVRVFLEKTANELVLLIKDQGNGFDWKQYLEFDMDRATHNHGRGIAISKASSFDSMEYRGNGNEVCCRVFL